MSFIEHNNQREFAKAFGIIKIGLIVFFVGVTVIYQAKYHGIKQANTFFGQPSSIGRVMGDAAVTGLLGVLSVVLVVGIREGFRHTLSRPSVWKASAIVFLILFLFSLSQESSGFNRYVAEDETAKGEGPYAELDGTTTEEGRKAFAETRKEGDFFISAVAYTAALMLLALILYQLYIMGRCTVRGYRSGSYSVASDPGVLLFLLEIFLLVVLNGFAPVISSKIRQESYSSKSTSIVIAISVVVVILHVMLQYNGFYKAAS